MPLDVFGTFLYHFLLLLLDDANGEKLVPWK